MRIPLLLSVVALGLTASIATPGAQAPAPKLTIDQLVQIKHPSGHQWSPDGSHVWFTWNDGGVNNVWAVAADGKMSCVEAWRIASDLCVSKQTISDAAEGLGLRVGDCQLGAF